MPSYPLKVTPLPLAFSSLPPPQQSLIYFPCLRLSLFWTFYINTIIQYTVFRNWLLSLSIIFARFIHVVAHVSAFYCQIIFPCMDTPHFFYTLLSWWWTFGLFPLVGYREWCCYKHAYTFLCRHVFSILLDLCLRVEFLGHVITPCLNF